MPGEQEIEFFGLVRVRGIFGVGAEEKNAAGDRVALERPALADPFAPAIIFLRIAHRNRRSYRSAANRDRRPAPRRLRPAAGSEGRRSARGLRARKRRQASVPLAAAGSTPAASRERRAAPPGLLSRAVRGGLPREGAGNARAEFCPAWHGGAGRGPWTL